MITHIQSRSQELGDLYEIRDGSPAHKALLQAKDGQITYLYGFIVKNKDGLEKRELRTVSQILIAYMKSFGQVPTQEEVQWLLQKRKSFKKGYAPSMVWSALEAAIEDEYKKGFCDHFHSYINHVVRQKMNRYAKPKAKAPTFNNVKQTVSDFDKYAKLLGE